jgi:hypothetical protein
LSTPSRSRNRPGESVLSRQLRLQSRDAVRRGFDFLVSAICDPAAFEEAGFDYLFALLTSLRSRDPVIRRRSLEVGQHLSEKWVAQHPTTVPPGADADMITELVFGSLSAAEFGVVHSLKPAIRAVASDFSAEEYLWFDPAVEPPPTDIPEDCECRASNPRGITRCHVCGETLAARSRYEVWLLAIIRSYLGERYGVTLGARHSDVLRWLPQMRPYPTLKDASAEDFRWSIYAITHIVYTLNDYHAYRLDRRWLRIEFETLRNCLATMIRMDDPETVGEIMDSLKAFGVNDSDRLMQRGIRYLLTCQNADGSWGETGDGVYAWHHTTIAALNGLDEYLWRGAKLCFPRIAPLLAHFH